MHPLPNPRHEKFCEAFVSGATAGNARASYKHAYGKDDRQAASRLRHHDDISRRIGELQADMSAVDAQATAKALKKLEITKERVLSELAKLAFSNMLDYVRITDDGVPVVDLSRLERDTAAAIQEVVVDTYVDGSGDDAREVRRIRFKLGDKRGALVDLGKHLGLFVETVRTPDLADALTAFVDRPPVETYEQWLERRKRELSMPTRGLLPSPAR